MNLLTKTAHILFEYKKTQVKLILSGRKEMFSRLRLCHLCVCFEIQLRFRVSRHFCEKGLYVYN